MRRLEFAVAGLLFAWLSVLAFVVPYDPDEAVYSIIARGIGDGEWPYRDLFDHKPPLIYAWYLPAALGAGIVSMRIVAAALVALSVLPFTAIARRWVSETEGRSAVLAYGLVLANPFLLTGANAEAFTLLPLVAALAVPSAFCAGSLFAVACLTKTSAVFFAPAVVMIWHRDWWKLAVSLVLTGAIAIAPFAPIWGDFWTANVTFNLEYAATVGRSARSIFAISIPVLAGSLPFYVLAAVGVAARPSIRLILLAVCGVLSVKATPFNFDHYYVLLAPPVALLAAVGWTRLARQRAPWRGVLGIAAGVSIASVCAGLVYTVARRDQDSDIRADVRARHGEFYLLGDRSQLYAVVDRDPERRFFFVVPLRVNASWREETLDELGRCPPDVVVVSKHGKFELQEDEVRSATRVYRYHAEYETGDVYAEPSVTCAWPAGR